MKPGFGEKEDNNRRGGFVATHGHNVTICLTPHPREMAYAFHAFTVSGREEQTA